MNEIVVLAVLIQLSCYSFAQTGLMLNVGVLFVFSQVNGISTKDLTHVQVVRLVITSGPCVTLTLKPDSKQRKHFSRQQPTGVRPTPLRTQHSGSCDVTPPGSPTFRLFHLPGYPYKQHGGAVESPSQLPMEVMRLDCVPPPPYTP